MKKMQVPSGACVNMTVKCLRIRECGAMTAGFRVLYLPCRVEPDGFAAIDCIESAEIRK